MPSPTRKRPTEKHTAAGRRLIRSVKQAIAWASGEDVPVRVTVVSGERARLLARDADHADRQTVAHQRREQHAAIATQPGQIQKQRRHVFRFGVGELLGLAVAHQHKGRKLGERTREQQPQHVLADGRTALQPAVPAVGDGLGDIEVVLHVRAQRLVLVVLPELRADLEVGLVGDGVVGRGEPPGLCLRLG